MLQMFSLLLNHNQTRLSGKAIKSWSKRGNTKSIFFIIKHVARKNDKASLLHALESLKRL